MTRTPKVNRFVAARLAAGYRYQQDAAQAAGIAQSVISGLESGRNTNPTWDVLGRLMQLYRVGCLDLLTFPKLPNHRNRGAK